MVLSQLFDVLLTVAWCQLHPHLRASLTVQNGLMGPLTGHTPLA